MLKPLGASPEAWAWFATRLGLASHLLPAVPDPQAPIAPESTLTPGQLGKIPSRYREDGYVVGFDSWTHRTIHPQEVKYWSVGSLYSICVRGRGACAFDLDVEDEEEALALVKEIWEVSGERLPVRIRDRSARVLLAFRLSEGELLKEVLPVKSGKVELLGTRQQWVACGTHPSGAKYRWDGADGLPDEIPILTRAQVAMVWLALGGERLKDPNARGQLKLLSGQEVGPDPVVRRLLNLGITRADPREGRWPIVCPWVSEHTMDGGLWEAVWHEAGSGGYAQGHFHCFHAACARRTDDDFFQAIGYRESVATMFNVDPEAPPPPADDCDRKPDTTGAPGCLDTGAHAGGSGSGSDGTPGQGALQREDRTDVGNTNMLARLTAGDLRWSWEMELWLKWTGERWRRDEPGEQARECAVQVAEQYRWQAGRELDHALSLSEGTTERTDAIKQARDTREWSFACRNRLRLGAMLEGARQDARFLVRARDLDRDPWLLGVENGVVDLRTGALRPAARDELITHSTGIRFDPQARAPRWERFIAEVTGLPGQGADDYALRPSLAAYLKRMLGCLCTGVVSDQKIFIAWGEGSNGKNILFDTLMHVLGDYAQLIPAAVLMATEKAGDPERPMPDIRKLQGARLALASETKDGQKMDVGLIKSLTGDRLLTARNLHENPITFERLFKPVLLTNHRPQLEHIDPAIRGRIHLIPFVRRWNRPGEPTPDVRLPMGDPGLEAALRAEATGILTWLVEGAVAYHKEGLGLCKEVEASTLAYLAEQDPVGRWLATLIACDPKQGATAQELYQSLISWALEEDITLSRMSPVELGRILHKKGITVYRNSTRRTFGLKMPPETLH